VEKIKSSDRVTVSLWETSAPGDDNHLLPAQFTGRDILAFAHFSPALYLRLRYDSRRVASTRCRLKSRAQRLIALVRDAVLCLRVSGRSRREVA